MSGDDTSADLRFGSRVDGHQVFAWAPQWGPDEVSLQGAEVGVTEEGDRIAVLPDGRTQYLPRTATLPPSVERVIIVPPDLTLVALWPRDERLPMITTLLSRTEGADFFRQLVLGREGIVPTRLFTGDRASLAFASLGRPDARTKCYLCKRPVIDSCSARCGHFLCSEHMILAEVGDSALSLILGFCETCLRILGLVARTGTNP